MLPRELIQVDIQTACIAVSAVGTSLLNFADGLFFDVLGSLDT